MAFLATVYPSPRPQPDGSVDCRQGLKADRGPAAIPADREIWARLMAPALARHLAPQTILTWLSRTEERGQQGSHGPPHRASGRARLVEDRPADANDHHTYPPLRDPSATRTRAAGTMKLPAIKLEPFVFARLQRLARRVDCGGCRGLVPESVVADSAGNLLNDLVGATEDRERDRQPERLGGAEIDY